MCGDFYMKNSVWADVKLPKIGPLEGNLSTDVLIIGGGLAGLLCAYRLEQDGVDYALIEADRILAGVSRNTTAKITSQHGLIYDKLVRGFGEETALGYHRANEGALDRYCQLARTIDCDFEEKDNYVYTVDFVDGLVKEMAALDRLGIKAEFVDKVPPNVGAAGAIRFQNQAQFHPLKFAAAIAKGLKIYEHTPAREFTKETVLTDYGKIKAKKVIVATHFPMNNKHGAYFLKMYQSRSYVLALENAGSVDGMYVDGNGALSFRQYGDLLLLGGGGHRTGKPGGGWAELEDFVKRHYPSAKERFRWATQDCMTLDGLPYIGRYSKHTPNLYVATGFNKWGMTSSMVAADLLGDPVQGRGNPYASVFDPSRTVLRPQLAVNMLEAAKSLMTFTKPRCPHMGCALKWNKQERSWDCPCHGSRFTEDGKLLNNPATDDL
jgi:glycine/D-amino acid oxidase-like deaminating enzyme